MKFFLVALTLLFANPCLAGISTGNSTNNADNYQTIKLGGLKPSTVSANTAKSIEMPALSDELDSLPNNYDSVTKATEQIKLGGLKPNKDLSKETVKQSWTLKDVYSQKSDAVLNDSWYKNSSTKQKMQEYEASVSFMECYYANSGSAENCGNRNIVKAREFVEYMSLNSNKLGSLYAAKAEKLSAKASQYMDRLNKEEVEIFLKRFGRIYRQASGSQSGIDKLAGYVHPKANFNLVMEMPQYSLKDPKLIAAAGPVKTTILKTRNQFFNDLLNSSVQEPVDPRKKAPSYISKVTQVENKEKNQTIELDSSFTTATVVDVSSADINSGGVHEELKSVTILRRDPDDGLVIKSYGTESSYIATVRVANYDMPNQAKAEAIDIYTTEGKSAPWGDALAGVDIAVDAKVSEDVLQRNNFDIKEEYLLPSEVKQRQFAVDLALAKVLDIVEVLEICTVPENTEDKKSRRCKAKTMEKAYKDAESYLKKALEVSQNLVEKFPYFNGINNKNKHRENQQKHDSLKARLVQVGGRM